MKLITVIIGTRPEAIKLGPLALSLKKSKTFQLRVILTGQHLEMVYQVLNLFQIKENDNLNIMKKNQSLEEITSLVIKGLKKELLKHPPNLVIVQGDTSSAFAAALSAFYLKIPIAHVEAGLRTNNIQDPFPEEMNGRLISQLASLHLHQQKSKRKFSGIRYKR